MDNKKKIFIGLGIVAAIVAIYLLYEKIMYEETDNAQIEAHTVMISPKVSGYVTQVNVLEGQRVKKDELLLALDDRDYQNALSQYRGELSSVEARRRDAERNFSRMGKLFKEDAVSQQQYDQAQAQVSEVRAKYDAVTAQVSQAELNIQNTKIKAPTDGFIAKKSVNVGQLAAIGVPLLGFVDATERWVIANFKETQLEGVKVGAEVDVDVDAISHKTFHGRVYALSAATGATFTLLPPDNATGNFTKVVQRVPVRIRLENLTADEIESLRAGLSADVKVHKR